MNKKKLEGNIIDFIRKGIESIISEKGECPVAALGILLKLKYPLLFIPGDWVGFKTLKNMLEAGPKFFTLYYRDEAGTDLCVKPTESIVAVAGNSKQNGSNRILDFQSYLNRFFTAEDCRKFRVENMVEYEECLSNDCVLRTNLAYKYHRAQAQGVLEERNNFGQVFHTGFFKNYANPIYMIWTMHADGLQTHRFVDESCREYRDMVRKLGNAVPIQPSFELLDFNTETTVEPDFGHIILERNYRIPESLFAMIRNYPELPVEQRYASNNQLAEKYYNYFSQLLLGTSTLKRIKNGTDKPVRYWHKTTNKMCWLIPLRMGITEKVDIALVLEPSTLNNVDVYIGRTILPLKEAFKSARVVEQVTAEWLKDAWRD
ncbi:MAG: DUF3825 domain-containing protein [Muribaculaceae bacterium]|nr:DUF3825 domain-containing protein [Muribaculaceae bacterium]